MNENPAASIVKSIKEISVGCNPKTGLLGKILAPPPNIKIAYGDIILDMDDIWISEHLLIGYRRTAKGTIVSETQPRAGGGGYAEFASHNHDYTGRKSYLVHNQLVVGDKVILLRESGGQRYIALDRYYNPNRGCTTK